MLLNCFSYGGLLLWVNTVFLLTSNPIILFNVLNFMKALWQGAAQFADVLEQFRKSKNFWKHISVPILFIESMQNKPLKTSNEKEVRSFTYQYYCQSTVLEIMAYELFLQKKLLYARQTSEVLNSGINNNDLSGKTKDKGDSSLKDTLSTWCGSSVLDNLIKSYTSCEFDNHKYIRLKVNLIPLFPFSAFLLTCYFTYSLLSCHTVIVGCGGIIQYWFSACWSRQLIISVMKSFSLSKGLRVEIRS